MAAPTPLSAAERQRIRELHAAGKARNDIARELGRSGSTISKACAAMGLEFDRTSVEAATAARLADAKAKRASLQLDLLDDATRLRAQLWQPAVVFNIGGRDNVYTEHDLPEPPHADKLKIMQTVGIAVDRSIRLAEVDADSGADAAKSMLGALATGLQAAYERLNSEDDGG